MSGDFVIDPRLIGDSSPLAQFELSDLRLMNDSNYPWLILIPRVVGARDLIDLDPAQRHALTDEIDRSARLLKRAFQPLKLNVAALGNVVAQLHVHVIARFENDPAWPAPVWGRIATKPYVPVDLHERIVLLRDSLGA
ncbi:MAG: HIT family protein [Dokdonella sp.]